MPEAVNVQEEITKLATDLEKRGVPMEQIADWFLITGAGILVQAIGRDRTADRLDDAVRKLRAGPPTIM